VLVATACCAAVVVSVPLLTAVWAYATAPGSTTDPVFEVRDRLIWVAALVVAALTGLALAWRPPRGRGGPGSPWLVLLSTAGLVGVATSAAWIDDGIGLGPSNLLLAVVLLPVLLLAIGPRSDAFMPYCWPVVAVVGLALYAPPLWQTPRGMYEPWHAAHVIDELLGPAAGSLPLADYVPQYGGLLGLPLFPFAALVSKDVPGWITAYLSILSLATVGVLCAVAALMLPSGRRVLAPVLVVPVLLMKPSPPSKLLVTGLQGFYQAIPGRSLLPAVLALALLVAVHRPGWRARWAWAGAAAGIAALSNFESGVPASLAAVLVLVALRGRWRALAQFLGAWLAVPVLYGLAVLATGGTPKISYWLAFTIEFAAGFGKLPMPPYGNFVLLLFVLAASTASAFAVLWRRRAAGPVPAAAVGGLFFGSWGLMVFPYYVGRSSSWGQLQFFLIPASIAAVWLLVSAAEALQTQRGGRLLAVGLLLCGLPSAVFVSGVLKAPSPEGEWLRLSGSFGSISKFRSTTWDAKPVLDPDRAAAVKGAAADASGPVALLLPSGHAAALMAGLPNVSILASPEEMLPNRPWAEPNDTDTGNETFRQMQCEYLQQSDANTVITDAAFAPALRCPGFTQRPAAGDLVVLTRTPG